MSFSFLFLYNVETPVGQILSCPYCRFSELVLVRQMALNWGQFCPQWDPWRYLEILLVDIAGVGLLLAFSVFRMLLNTL